ncbi:MAG: hypothetical protein ACN6QT_13120 [Burkholderia contaminans]|uniref:Uncharacterized protein n=1 Tax=Burkholderia contaminans TaxID=488447 RepID=A0AAP4QXI7_9BURK|nr:MULTISPECIES: hypothetical protein [Burkholderia]MBD1410110.1 hypothetical protein [Burkholderia contaminans]MBH9668449.1 hypothetical protein [Burkholderia contaminans]MBH9675269.1 hypothetical protein [Burkholderia contaminans]MBH9705692.1 hypothetical protein [Burkholderia contaminans]MBM6425396.1 hypothetical protein [Burkholderia contaminans]
MTATIRGIVYFVIHCNCFSFFFCAPRENSAQESDSRNACRHSSRAVGQGPTGAARWGIARTPAPCAPAENLLEIPGPNFYIIQNHACITALTTQTLHVPEMPKKST